MNLHRRLNDMDEAEATAAMKGCCGASRWAAAMVAARPFSDDLALFEAADALWAQMARGDILEAFEHHPRIGADIAHLREKFAATAELSASEQSGVDGASEETLERLRDGNLAYEARFGFIFIVCASGKSAGQMLELLEARISNESGVELGIAAAEQHKITHLRLQRLVP